MALLAVAAGAFGAHGLKQAVTADLLVIFETGARYHMYHALGLLAVGVAAGRWPSTWVHASGALFVAGILIFSGSLYVMTLTGARWLGAVTPLGGLAFIAGWAALLYLNHWPWTRLGGVVDERLRWSERLVLALGLIAGATAGGIGRDAAFLRTEPLRARLGIRVLELDPAHARGELRLGSEGDGALDPGAAHEINSRKRCAQRMRAGRGRDTAVGDEGSQSETLNV